MKIKLAGWCLLLCLGWLPKNSWALCLGCSCNVESASNIAFGNYSPFSSGDIDVTGEIRVRCTSLVGLLASIDLKLSTGASGSYTPRTMMSGSNTLNYNLYTNSSRTNIWGDGTGGTSIVTNSFTLLALTALHGYLQDKPAQQSAATATRSRSRSNIERRQIDDDCSKPIMNSHSRGSTGVIESRLPRCRIRMVSSFG
ncbi:MAG: SCPU domain-containing protein [Betaproteobacteria bacterium HGW-Betaproteobacteria-8]|nr:MAG: SCPU domain-containing protein [Betaproteobacteria bacterium HGW-Betaproteobacteria-8]